MKVIIILISKCISFVGGLLNRGSSLPGYVALKLDQNILSKLTLPEHTVVVTGTNGKTSTSNYIATVLQADGKKVVHNSSGANMLQGIVSIILKNVSFSGKLKADYLVLEVDEAFVKEISQAIKPEFMVVTNIFEDQVDRFATLDGVESLIYKGITPNTTLVLNADDPYAKHLADKSGNNVIYFGIDAEHSEPSMDEVCPECHQQLKYDYQIYNHLGDYHCECGFKHPKAVTYLANQINLKEKQFMVGNDSYQLNNGALYIVYNMMATIAVCREFGVDAEIINQALKTHSVGMGRMETMILNNHETFLNLVKNAAGLNQTLEYINNLETGQFNLFLSVHSREPDSDNIEWLKDSESELFEDARLQQFVLSGDEAQRVADVFINLGVAKDKVRVIEDLDQAINHLLEDDISKAYFLANYSSLNEVRNKLVAHQKD